MIDAELDEALNRLAAQEGVSKAELLRRFARERVRAELPPSEQGALWKIIGAADGPDLVADRNTGRVSEHVDAVLHGEPDGV